MREKARKSMPGKKSVDYDGEEKQPAKLHFAKGALHMVIRRLFVMLFSSDRKSCIIKTKIELIPGGSYAGKHISC